jgi:uncharacterized membrane protein YadS
MITDDRGYINMNEEKNNQKTSAYIIRPFVVGLYTWLAAISFGLVLLDIVYAGLVPDAATALREAADFMLQVDAIMLFAALGAIGLSWNSKSARNYLVASLAVVILGFWVYMLLSSLPQGSSSLGPLIRIILAGSVSVLAFMGFYKSCRDG